MSIDKQMTQENAIYANERILFNLEKEGDSVMCCNGIALSGHYAKWNKSVTEKQIPCDSTYVRYLQWWRSQNQRVGCRSPRIGRKGIWELLIKGSNPLVYASGHIQKSRASQQHPPPCTLSSAPDIAMLSVCPTPLPREALDGSGLDGATENCKLAIGLRQLLVQISQVFAL